MATTAPATKIATGSRDARILANISFTRKGAGTQEVADYSTLARSFFRDLAQELEMSAAQIEAGLVRTMQGSFTDRAMAKMTARRTIRRLRSAASHAEAAANDCGRFWGDYAHMYAQLINPDGRQWGFRNHTTARP